MTKTQFFFANILSNLGFPRTQKRLLDAADELHLLKEAQEVLGRNIWSNLKDKSEYEEIVNEIEHLLSEKTRLSEKAAVLKEEVQEIREKESSIPKTPNNSESDMQQEFRREQTKMAEIKTQQAKIKSDASVIKQEHDQARKYLNKIIANGETDQSAIKAQESKIESLKMKFSNLKTEKGQLDLKLAKAVSLLNKMSKSISNTNDQQQDSTVQKFKAIGEKNKEISILLSRVGIIDNQISSLHGEIGKVISLQSLEDSECRKLVDKHFGLCKIMKALRASIRYNHSLGGRT